MVYKLNVSYTCNIKSHIWKFIYVSNLSNKAVLSDDLTCQILIKIRHWHNSYNLAENKWCRGWLLLHLIWNIPILYWVNAKQSLRWGSLWQHFVEDLPPWDSREAWRKQDREGRVAEQTWFQLKSGLSQILQSHTAQPGSHQPYGASERLKCSQSNRRAPPM